MYYIVDFLSVLNTVRIQPKYHEDSYNGIIFNIYGFDHNSEEVKIVLFPSIVRRRFRLIGSETMACKSRLMTTRFGLV